MTFPQINAELRTNEEFRSNADPNHHRTTTPLVDLPIDMILDFPSCDALHLLHLGIMKRLLVGWQTGAFGYRTKWSSWDEKSISAYLIRCKTPVEIHRGMRSLREIPRWKATEFRTFLLYVSIVVLKKHLPSFYYDHFLLLFCSVVILNSEYFIQTLLPYADDMIKSYLNIFKDKYGAEHFTSNLHNLSHLVSEVKRFGPLCNFDAYKFENKLQQIKKMIRSGRNHIVQIRNRLTELELLNSEMPIKEHNTDALAVLTGIMKLETHEHIGGLAINANIAYKMAKFSTFEIRTHMDVDKWVLTKDQEIVAAKHFILNAQNNECYFVGSAILEKKNFFDKPFQSSSLFIFAASKTFDSPKIYDVKDIVCKLFPLDCLVDCDDSESETENQIGDDTFDIVFIPLWHTLE